MTPVAREELRRYCADAARARKVREPWTMTDKTDAEDATAVGRQHRLIGRFG